MSFEDRCPQCVFVTGPLGQPTPCLLHLPLALEAPKSEPAGYDEPDVFGRTKPTIGHTRMAALTHAMETRLDDVRKGIAPVTAGLIEALLKALDVLKLLRDEVETRVAADVDVDAAASAVERRAALREAAPAVVSQ